MMARQLGYSGIRTDKRNQCTPLIQSRFLRLGVCGVLFHKCVTFWLVLVFEVHAYQ